MYTYTCGIYILQQLFKYIIYCGIYYIFSFIVIVTKLHNRFVSFSRIYNISKFYLSGSSLTNYCASYGIVFVYKIIVNCSLRFTYVKWGEKLLVFSLNDAFSTINDCEGITTFLCFICFNEEGFALDIDGDATPLQVAAKKL